jgi:hypothetical protein
MNDAAKLRRLIKKMGKCKSTEKLRKMLIEVAEIAGRNDNNPTCQQIMKTISDELHSPDALSN